MRDFIRANFRTDRFMIARMFRLGGAIVLLLATSAAFCSPPRAGDSNGKPMDDHPDAIDDAGYFARYTETIRAGLESSANPRDWAVDAMTFYFDGNASATQGETSAHASREKLLARAIDAAPGDALVQWMAIAGSRTATNYADYEKALANLKAIEPENAAVWEEDLARAAHDRNRAEVSAALTRMAHSTTFTNHYAQIADEIIRGYQSVPFPQETLDRMKLACPECAATKKEDMPLLAATATTAALGLPAFQSLTIACRTNDNGINADRKDDCQKIGRLLAATGDTMIAMRIGSAVLRVSRSFDDGDVAQGRQNDWIWKQSAGALDRGDGTGTRSLDTARQFQTDWSQTGSEMGAMRKAIERAGLPAEPPADWLDSSASFAPERLREDQERTVAFDY
jgi:hypothetical protein